MTDDNFNGCGISQIWATSEKDPFYLPCLAHDSDYEQGSEAQRLFKRKEIDDLFLAKMIAIAGSSILLKMKAYLFYYLVRIFGEKYWEGRR